MNLKYLLMMTSLFFFQSLNAQWFSLPSNTGKPATDSLPSVGGSWNDINNDGYPDLLITGFDAAQNNRIYFNQQDGSYNQLDTTPFTQTPGSWGAVVGLTGDYDNDGDEDVMVCNFRDNNSKKLPLVLMVNQGAPDYDLIVDTAFVTPIGSYDSGSWVDYDLDGDLDFHTAAANGSTDLFYRNEGDGSFLQIDSLSFLKYRTGQIVEASWLDLDRDGDLDLYIGNYSSPNANTFHKSMFMETGDPNFFINVKISGLTAEPGANIGYNWIDYDNDGDLDLYLNHYLAKDRMFRNEGGLVFTEILGQPMLNPVAYTNFNAWADYDNDGDLDLAVAYQQVVTSLPRIFENRNGDFFQLSSAEAGDISSAEIFSAQAAGLADHDNDGDVDLYITCTRNVSIGAKNFLFENEAGVGQNWLKVKLTGVESNRNGYGAEIFVKAVVAGDTVRQMRHVSGGTTSHAFQDCTVQHFGLGDATEVISVEVHWPNGNLDICKGLMINQQFELEEGMCYATGTRVNEPIAVKDYQWITVFPNPVKAILHFEELDQNKENQHFEIMMPSGQTILKSRLTDSNSIDVSNLPAGVYFIKMNGGDLIKMGKFVKT